MKFLHYLLTLRILLPCQDILDVEEDIEEDEEEEEVRQLFLLSNLRYYCVRVFFQHFSYRCLNKNRITLLFSAAS